MNREIVLAFDCFGTVFDTSGIPAHEVRGYIEQVKRPEWLPLVLPPSWVNIPAHADSAEGIRRLRSKYRVVTCSNLPVGLLRTLSDTAGIHWDAIVPLEASRTYKPHPHAYATVCDVMQVEPASVVVVTAHATGPDIKGASGAGMDCLLIRQPCGLRTIIELADRLVSACGTTAIKPGE